jgi:predicted  nucleic acid-binding Zn-ribbon protein
MSQLDETAQRLDAALVALESTVQPLLDARAQAARDAAEIARLAGERERLLARIADLEEETRSLGGLTEEIEGRLDGAIAEIRTALAR